MQVEIKLNFTEEDFELLKGKAAETGIKVSELLESFTNDLVCGTYTNGSDERMYANDWFSRCTFDNFYKNSFLRYLNEVDALDSFIDNCNYVFHCSRSMFTDEEFRDIEAEMREDFSDYCNSELCHEQHPDFWQSARQIYEWSCDFQKDYTLEHSADMDMEM